MHHATRIVWVQPAHYARLAGVIIDRSVRAGATMDIVRGIVTVAVLAASFWPASIALAQQPATGPAQDLLTKVSRQTQTSFCRSQGLLTCLKLEKADCEKRIGPIMTACLKNPGAMQTIQNENFVRSALLGCVLGAFLSGNPRANEATACIQRAGKAR